MEKDRGSILVSIIVPVYNVELYLEKCINSLLGQTYKNIEIILSDDGSIDKSGEICDLYAAKDDRIRVIHKANGGLSEARNAGLDIMRGEYVTFVDSDDYLEVEAIEKLVSSAIQGKAKIAHMKSYIVASDYSIITNQSNNTGKVVSYTSKEYVKGMCEKKFSESVCDKLFRCSLFENRRFEKGRLNEDFFFLARLLFEELIIAEIDYAGYNYYQRKGSITNSGFGKSLVDSVKNAYELKELAKVNRPDMEEYFARLTLYQVRTLFIVMPWAYVKTNSEIYKSALVCLRNSIDYIKIVSMSWRDRLFLRMVYITPKLTIRIVSILWSIKRMLDEKR